MLPNAALPGIELDLSLTDHRHHHYRHQKQQAAIKTRAKVKRFTVNKKN